MKKILITGATGYIGRRLKERLLADGRYSIRLLVRNIKKVRPEVRGRVDVVEGDTFDRDALARAVKGIDMAFYLIHSMGAGKDFETRVGKSAENFLNGCIKAKVKTIICLGGLGDRESASPHLAGRIETGDILSSRSEEIRTIRFRAGVIIGSGSMGFEIIRDLVRKLPIMVTPRWAATITRPIGVDDVLDYLVSAVDCNVDHDLVVDIGVEKMTFAEMMVDAAGVMGLRRRFFPVPVLFPRLSSYWLVLFTPVPFAVASALVAGLAADLESETVAHDDRAARYFPDIHSMDYRQAVGSAIHETEKEQILSRWCDSSSDASCDILNQDDPSCAVLRDTRQWRMGDLPAEKVFASIMMIGGKEGWFTYHFLWRLRGLMDKMAGGYGLNRGRRLERELRVGDSLDFWKVVDIRPNRRLLLLAQMKLPGKAWLEFAIQDRILVQTAHFLPQGLLGRAYWYAVMPLHFFVFRDLVKKIVARGAE